MNNKAWVRQWIALMMTAYVIILGIIKACLVDFGVDIYMLLTGPAYTYIGWFFTSREYEKSKERKER